MKIDSVTLYHVRMPLVSAFETSFGRTYTRDCILIEIEAEGMSGYGECVADRDPGYAYETVGTAWHILKDFLIPSLILVEISDAADLQQKMSHVKGHQMAKAGLEMALWDLIGIREGKSLRELVGGDRQKVAVGVSVGIQQSPTHLVDTVKCYVDQGYQRVKLKIKPGRDFADVMAVRRVFPDLKLMVDANSAYTLATVDPIHQLDALDLLMIEQPLAEDDLWDHRALQSELDTPICLDESIISPRHARQALEMESCRIINIKQGRVGGISQALAIHDLCQEQGVPVWCGGMLETGVGRSANLALASLPNFSLPGDISATARYYGIDITREKFSLNMDSTIDVPAGPGLGIQLDFSALEMFTLTKLTLPE